MAGGRPIRALNVAEKPSVAKAVSGILSKSPSSGGLRVRDGRSRYNKIFEFNYTIQNQHFHMSFTSVTGHLMELEFEERYRKWHSCDPVQLYQAAVKKYVPEVQAFNAFGVQLSDGLMLVSTSRCKICTLLYGRVDYCYCAIHFSKIGGGLVDVIMTKAAEMSFNSVWWLIIEMILFSFHNI